MPRLQLKHAVEHVEELQLEAHETVELKVVKQSTTTLKRQRKPSVIYDVETVECDRRQDIDNFNGRNHWKLKLRNGRVIRVEKAVIKKAKFRCNYVNGGGCGGGFYTGKAAGSYNPRSPVKTSGARRLGFHKHSGYFYDAETGNGIKGASKIVLLPNCESVYFPEQ